MAKKQPPKRKSAAQRKKATHKAKSPKPKKQKAPQPVIEPLYGDVFDKIINKRANWVALGLMLLLILIVFGDYLFGPYLYLFKDIGSDTINDVYPRIAMVYDLKNLEGGSSWSFSQGMGNTSNSGGFLGLGFGINPFNVIRNMGSREALPYRTTIIGVMQLMLAGVFVFQYLRTVGFEKMTIIAGSIIYVFSGYVMGVHSWYAYNNLIMGAPLLLWGTELILKKNNWIVLPIAIYLLVGPRLVVFGFFLIVYSFFRYIDVNGWDWKGLFIFWVKIGLLTLLGIAICANTFGLSLVKMFSSSRVTGEASQIAQTTETPIFALNSYMINTTSLLRSFANDLLGGPKDFKGYRNYLEAPFYYIGIVSLLLIPQAIYFAKKWRKALFGGFLTFWLLFCIFPYFRYAYFLFVTDHFRSFCLHASISFLFLALFALNEIVKGGKVHLMTLGISLGVLLIALNYPYFNQERIDGGMHFAANAFLIISALLLFIISRPNLKYIGLGLLLVTITAELAVLNYHTTHDRDPLTKSEYKAGGLYNDSTLEALKQIEDQDSGLFRIQKGFTSSKAMHYSLNDAMAQGFYSTPSYQSINQKSYIDFLVATGIIESNDITRTKWAPGLRGRPLLEILASVKYQLRQDNGSDLIQFGYKKIGGVDNIRIFQSSLFLPFGYTYDKYFTSSELKQLRQSQKDLGMLKAAIIFDQDEEKVSHLAKFNSKNLNTNNLTLQAIQNDIDQRKRGAFQLTQFEQDHLQGEVNLEKEKLVFFSIPYHKGWSIYVNGKKVETLKVNIGFMGAMVPQGTHKLELVHDVMYLSITAPIAVVGFLIFCFLIFLQVRKRKKIREGLGEESNMV